VKVGWIYPHRERCGITRYSLDYINAIADAATIVDIDPRWWITDRGRFFTALYSCDLLHLQYDTAAFMNGRRDFFGPMMRHAMVPAIVSLHEVYDEDPAAFPRSRLTGRLLLRQLKQAVWDLRHPVQLAFERHVLHRFGAQTILVHHRYHADILIRKGIPAGLPKVFPHPVKRSAPVAPVAFPDLPHINLGVPGFINPSYDYDLLFGVLEELNRPWTFTWIGGIRAHEQQPLLDFLTARIARLNWQDKFHITGWVSEEEMSLRLASIDLVFALFKARSSSGSLARALGAGKPVIATDLPLTREIASFAAGIASSEPAPQPLLLSPAHAGTIVDRIERLVSDPDLQKTLFAALSAYSDAVSFEAMAQKLLALYRGTVRR
jgi:glycosyltransferase involved in cell wall biosynthesis